MIEFRCTCAKAGRLPESAVGKRARCPGCGKMLQFVSAEPLAEGAGLGDFDASLIPVPGQLNPEADQYLLGGAADIHIGKAADRNILLHGQRVSRQHCKLVRVNFAPGVWKIFDFNSTNGLIVNGQRVIEHELQDGDTITIGEYTFEYFVDAAPTDITLPSVAGAISPPSTSETICPSCERTLLPTAAICVDCGIRLPSGRPLVTSQGFDQEQLRRANRERIRWYSLFIPITPVPVPLQSEALGAKKPYALWAILAITIITSFCFFIARYRSPISLDFDRPGSDLMLWSPWATHNPATVADLKPALVRRIASLIRPDERIRLHEKYDPDGHMSDYQLSVALLLDVKNHDRGEFHWYQLFTYMFLHDTSGIIAFAMHLGGNLIFLVIIGSRVNSVIGNLATAVVYILLGVCSAAVFLIVAGPDNHGAMLGASGAIMGMAGIYLVLFPVQKIICAMWIRIVPLVKSLIISKTFALRGFLLLVIYFAFDIAMNALEARLNPNGGDGVAHWAHIGGFLCGILVGLGLVFSRQFKITGDLVSLIFGKLAWPLTGKPSQWATRRQTLLGSLAFSGGAAAMLGLVLLVLAVYDPRTQADQFADNGGTVDSPPAANADGNSPADDNSDTQSGAPTNPNPAPSAPPPARVFATPSDSTYSSSLPDGATETEMIGGHGGDPYIRVDPEKRIVIGFSIRIGHWNGHETIGHCEPLFERPTDPPPGGTILCVAREGYAVSGILVSKIDGADAMQVSFARTTSSGVDISDRYASDWFGCTDMGHTTQLAGHGERIIGTFGRQGMNNDAIGLVIDSTQP